MLNCFSCVRLFTTLWSGARQAPLFMGFSRQVYWSGLLCPPSGDLPDPAIKFSSPALQADSLLTKPPRKPNLFHPRGSKRCMTCEQARLRETLPGSESLKGMPPRAWLWVHRSGRRGWQSLGSIYRFQSLNSLTLYYARNTVYFFFLLRDSDYFFLLCYLSFLFYWVYFLT